MCFNNGKKWMKKTFSGNKLL